MEEISGEFIAGFVEGEGFFSLNWETTGKKHGHEQGYTWLRPKFSVGVNKRDLPLLKEIQKKLKCGRIYNQKGTGKYKTDQKHDCVRLWVYRLSDLKNILIPFFDKYQFYGNKKIVFEAFKEIIEIICKNKHKTSEDIKKLLVLKENLVNYAE